MAQLSWRGLIKDLYKRSSYRMSCQCDNHKSKLKAGTMISHIKTKHQHNNAYNVEQVIIYSEAMVWFCLPKTYIALTMPPEE